MNRQLVAYRPSNGLEGELFYGHWCGRCVHDRNEDCPILAATLAYQVGDPNYPKEWVEEIDLDDIDFNSEPRCTAFYDEETADIDPPKYRCPDTVDMFPGGE